MGDSKRSRIDRWVQRVYWLGFGILAGQILLVGYSFGSLPGIVNLGSFAGNTKTGPKETLWVFPAISALMIALAWVSSFLPVSGMGTLTGRVADSSDHKRAHLLVVIMFVFFAGCVGVGELACILENFGHAAAMYAEPVVAVLITVVPPILLLLFVWFRPRAQRQS